MVDFLIKIGLALLIVLACHTYITNNVRTRFFNCLVFLLFLIIVALTVRLAIEFMYFQIVKEILIRPTMPSNFLTIIVDGFVTIVTVRGLNYGITHLLK